MATILIVDDRSLNREFLVMLLGYGNHHLLEAENGAEAFEILKRESVDLMITDILMPVMDGYELVCKVRQDACLTGMPVIFYTATYRTKEARMLANSCGVEFVLSKPCDPQLILETVAKALGLKKTGGFASSVSFKSIIPMESLEINRLEDVFARSLTGIEAVKKYFDTLIHNIKELEREQHVLIENLQLLSDNLIQLRKLSNQLVTIAEFKGDLISESDQKQLLYLFGKGIRKVLGVKYVVLGVLNKQKTEWDDFLAFCEKHQGSPGFEVPQEVDQGLIGQILRERKMIHLPQSSEPIPQHDLPFNHPPITSFLGIPMASKTNLFGFVYLADKSDGGEFSSEDQQVSQTLVYELASLYENLDLYDSLQRHAAKLQIEMTQRKKVQEELARSEQLFRQFAENIQEVFFRSSPQMDQMIYISPSFEEIWGCSIEDCYANPHHWFQAILPEDKPMVRKSYEDLMHEGVKRTNVEFRIMRPDGKIRHIYSRTFKVWDDQQNVVNMIGIASDITEYQQARRRAQTLLENENILKKVRSLKEAIPLILKNVCQNLSWQFGEFWMIDSVQNVMRCIDIWKEEELEVDFLLKTSFELSLARGIGIPGLAWQNKRSFWSSSFEKTPQIVRLHQLQQSGLHSAFCALVRYDKEIYGALTFFSLHLEEPDHETFKVIESIAEQLGLFIHQKHTEEEIAYISHYDLLTGWMNRTFFETHMDTIIKKNPQFLGLIMFDIDRFKIINEELGHEGGDILLSEMTNKIQKAFADNEVIFARVGAEKFVLGVLHPEDEKGAIDRIQLIQDLMKSPFFIKGQEIFITLSFGISLYPHDGLDVKVLLQNSEIVLNRVKEQGGNHFQFLSQENNSLMPERILLETQLRTALLQNQFCLFYQPKLDLKTRKICGYEALIRWNHPEKGLIAPDYFIPQAEDSGLIVPIGEWVIKEVFDHIKTETVFSKLSVPISINLSIHQLTPRHKLIEYLKELIKEKDVDPKLIEIEITENIWAKDIETHLEFMNAIKELGMQISIDDFGTGYCSLKYIHRFPIDCIKIDQSFIEGIPHDPYCTSIVKTIISLAKNIGVKTIAEGVELEEQQDYLVQEKCDEIQGYMVSRPLSLNDLKKFMRSSNKFL